MLGEFRFLQNLNLILLVTCRFSSRLGVSSNQFKSVRVAVQINLKIISVPLNETSTLSQNFGGKFEFSINEPLRGSACGALGENPDLDLP